MQDTSAALGSALLAQAQASHNHPVISVQIAWERTESDAEFAVVGTSTVGGDDIIQGADDSAVANPDRFDFTDESDRVLSLDWDRSIDDMFTGVTYATATLVLDNSDLRYTPGEDVTIGDYIKRGRPIRIYAGYRLPSFGTDHAIPQFKGLIMTPRENKMDKTVEIRAVGYLSWVRDRQMGVDLYQNVTTDQVIRDVLLRAGFSTDQLDLDVGINYIGTAWFSDGITINQRLNDLIRAEMGHLYLDEFGIIHFDNRQKYVELGSSLHTLASGDILDWQELESQQVINRCMVVGRPRTVLAEQIVWQNSKTEPFNPGETREITANLDNPVTTVVTPVISTDLFANSAEDDTGADTSSDFTVDDIQFTPTEIKLTITNGGATLSYITALRLRGTPAVTVSEIIETYEDIDSQDEFGLQEYTIENEFISEESFAYYLARSIVRKFKDPKRRARITIIAIPQLQLKDYITVTDPDTGETITMRVMRIQGSVGAGEFIQIVDMREITDDEIETWAIVGTSTVGGDDVVAPSWVT